jgi:hypothetical protein
MMSAYKKKLVDDPINANGSANKVCFRIWRILENEVVAVEGSQLLTANPTCHLGSTSQLLYVLR